MNGTNIGNGYIRGSRRRSRTAHDWAAERESTVWDDGTMTYFWQTHTLTALLLIVAYLVYVAAFEPPSFDRFLNARRGVIFAIGVFIILGVTHIPDGPFRRPHPALWRFVFCLTILYELQLIFAIFQTVDDARQYLKIFDANLGQPLPEKDYGGNCLIYDPDRPDDVFHNVWDKMDGFVVVHFIGWFAKTIMFRDFWLCMVQQILFEMLEYSLEHQLPNFSECWWDHWIMDALLCNTLGIYCGMHVLRYYNMKSYNWRGIWKIPSLRGKMTRVAQQFTPYSWMDFDWSPLRSFKHWIAVIGIIFVTMVAELNFFYLKFVLWLPPPHYLNLIRLIILLLSGAVAVRETFQYLDDPDCHQFGRQSWMILSIVATEFLLIVKFDSDGTVRKPLPNHIFWSWIIFLVALIGWTCWNFFIRPYRETRRPTANGQVQSESDDSDCDLQDYSENSVSDSDDILQPEIDGLYPFHGSRVAALRKRRKNHLEEEQITNSNNKLNKG